MSTPTEIRNDREQVYGSPAEMLRCWSAHCTALLQSHYQGTPLAEVQVPPHVAGLMLACLKLHRAAAPFPKRDRDSYLDVHNYIDFAEESDPTLPGED